MSLQEKQAPIDLTLFNALIAATPETWNMADMIVERTDENGIEKMNIEISSPEGHKDLVTATDEIYEGLYMLSDCYRGEKKMWSMVKYQVSLNNEGNWQCKASFDY
jgi:hypothetical protein